MELLLIVEVKSLENSDIFQRHLKKEGFIKVENEEFVYIATSSTTTYATKAYILEVVKVALQKSGSFDSCRIIFQLDNMPFQAYKFDKEIDFFEEISK